MRVKLFSALLLVLSVTACVSDEKIVDVIIDIYKQEIWQRQTLSTQSEAIFNADERVIDSILKTHQMDKNEFYERLDELTSTPKELEKVYQLAREKVDLERKELETEQNKQKEASKN